MILYMARRTIPRSQVKAKSDAVTISSKGQVTIPKEVRLALGLKPLDRVTFEVQEGVAVVRPAGSFLARFGSIRPRRRPEDFRKVREEVSRRTAAEVAGEGR